MNEIRKRIMRMMNTVQQSGEPYFFKAANSYISTGISVKTNGTNYNRTIILDYQPITHASEARLWGVANPTNVSRNRLALYFDGTVYSLVGHTGNSSSKTVSSDIIPTGRHTVGYRSNPDSTTLFLDSNTYNLGIRGQALSTYSYSTTLYFGALHTDSASLGNWSGNIYRFAIYPTSDASGTPLYELVPRLKDGVYQPYETVTQTFAEWLTIA